LNKNGVPVGSVYTAKDIFSSEQVSKRKSLVDIDDPEVGSYKFARGPVMLSGSPEVETNPAPNLGQHTIEILKDVLNYSDNQITQLEKTRIIQTD